MAKSVLRHLQRAAWLALILAGTTVHAAPQALTDRRHDNGEPRPVTTQGRFAGFVATPQLSDDGPSEAFAIAPDQRWFAASSREATAIRVMELRTGVTLRVLRTGGRKIVGLSISADSRVVHAIDDDGKPLAWTAATGERVSADEKTDGITRIDRLTIDRSDNDNPASGEQKDASGGRKRIGEFLENHGLTEPLAVLPSIEKVLVSLDGRYAVIVDDKSDQSIQEGYREVTSYRGMKIWDLRHLSAPVLVKIPDDWCGHYLNSFAFDGRYVVLGTRGGEGDHAYTDSAAFEVSNGTAEPLWHAECTVGSEFEDISRDTRFYTVSAGPEGPVTVWDLRTARRAAPRNRIRIGSLQQRSGLQSPDGQLIAVHRESNAASWGYDIIDVATGRALLHAEFFARFTSDSRYVISKTDFFPNSFTLREIATGRKMWSLQGTPDLGFVMTFSDGRVRVSPGAEKYVKLVRGFEVEPYDEAARGQFELKGRWEP
jgi:WD40 repeat protein